MVLSNYNDESTSRHNKQVKKEGRGIIRKEKNKQTSNNGRRREGFNGRTSKCTHLQNVNVNHHHDEEPHTHANDHDTP